MNDTLWDYCQEYDLVFTRSRAYRKNDQAWVEQKNGAIVRKLMVMVDWKVSPPRKRRAVSTRRRDFVNFFQPSFKLKGKEREGAKVRKDYHSPETPFRRLILRDNIPENSKQQLQQQFELLDPVLLLKHTRDAQDAIVAITDNLTPPPLSEDLQKFVSSLATLLKLYKALARFGKIPAISCPCWIACPYYM